MNQGKNPKSSDFSGEFRSARKKLGMSQAQFAEALGVDRAYISMIETGKRDPSERLRSELANAVRMYGEGREIGKGSNADRDKLQSVKNLGPLHFKGILDELIDAIPPDAIETVSEKIHESGQKATAAYLAKRLAMRRS